VNDLHSLAMEIMNKEMNALYSDFTMSNWYLVLNLIPFKIGVKTRNDG
jgi:hypothetical protein